MASIFNHSDFWYMSGEGASSALLNFLGKHMITFSWIQGVILSVLAPVIISSNGLVVYAVWKDPLKNLRNASPNFILQSMAVADLLVGLVLSPVDAYWLLTIAVSEKMPFSFHAIYSLSTTFLGASFAHVLLISIDRLCAVFRPLRYKAIVTRRRINLAVTLLWVYFICFGIATFMFEKGFFVTSFVFIAQTFVLLNTNFCLYLVILYRLRKNNKLWQKRILKDSVRVSQKVYADKEARFAKLLALAIVVSLFIITPYFVLITLVYFCVPCYSYPMMLLVSTGLETTLSHLQSVVNPFVYCWRLPKYRQVWRHYIQSTAQCCTGIKRRCRGKEDCSFDTKL